MLQWRCVLENNTVTPSLLVRPHSFFYPTLLLHHYCKCQLGEKGKYHVHIMMKLVWPWETPTMVLWSPWVRGPHAENHCLKFKHISYPTTQSLHSYIFTQKTWKRMLTKTLSRKLIQPHSQSPRTVNKPNIYQQKRG